VLIAVLWGIFLSPKARVTLPPRLTFALRVAVLLGSALALGGWLGIALAVAVVLDNAALAALD
jgi:hypothetical protein